MPLDDMTKYSQGEYTKKLYKVVLQRKIEIRQKINEKYEKKIKLNIFIKF